VLRTVKYGKILVVVFLTVLIWVWADLELDEELPVSGATITVTKSDPKRWVSFEEESSVSIEEVVLKGPLTRIAEVRRRLEGGKGIEFSFDAAQQKMNEPGEHALILLPFLQKNEEIKRLGLEVESCKPDKLSVKVVELVKRELKVKCVDEDENPVEADIKPVPHVDMFVPEDWVGDAKVRLGRAEIEHARLAPISKTPYIRLGDQIREAQAVVEITTPQERDLRQDYLVTATYAIALSPNLQGEYKVVITNREAVLAPIAIRATPEAKRAYEGQAYPPMTLYILDDDIKKGTEEQQRTVVYNFPPELFRKGEIELQNPQQPVEARFKLIKVPAGATE